MLDEKVKEAISESVKVAVWVRGFINAVKNGNELKKEELAEHLSRIFRAKELIRKCEKERIPMHLERRDIDDIEEQLWALILERL